jgi:glyoxylase-like metal-dependent hydrolase (beta-lactamase superfamily II)
MSVSNKDWFKISKIDTDTFAISEPAHWERTNCYLFLGGDFNVLVDTGLGIGNMREAVYSISDKPVKVVTTHAHWDHIGGHALFDTILLHSDDADWLENGIPLPEKMILEGVTRGLRPEELPENFDIQKYRVFRGRPSAMLGDGEEISLGSRTLKALHTPGHSSGHICIYEEATGYLATGDIFYTGLIHAYYPSTDPVAIAASIKRLAALPKISRILPGHHVPAPIPQMLREADVVLDRLGREGKIHHGSGTYQLAEGVSIKM